MTPEEINEIKQNKAKYMPLIQAAEFKYQIPQNMLVQLIQQESAFSTSIITGDVLSRAGARGIAQFMPDTATEWAKRLKIDDNDKWKPEAQIRMAGAFLSDSINKFARDPNPNVSNNAAVFAFAEYNAGFRNIKKAIDLARHGEDFISSLPKETQKYVQSVKNWAGSTSENIQRFEKIVSPTKHIFLGFSELSGNISKLGNLSSSSKKKMANFLLDVGKGKKITLR